MKGKCKNCDEKLPYYAELIGKEFCCEKCENQYYYLNKSDKGIEELRKMFGMK